MLEGRRLVEPERDIGDVVEIGVGFECCDQHPIERKGGEDDEEGDCGIKRAFFDCNGGNPRHVRFPAAG
jgi:hypothetical protein